MKEKFTFFWHSPSPFSQWHPSVFMLNDRVFTSAEQGMMYWKASLFGDKEIAEAIIRLNDAVVVLYDQDGKVSGSRKGVLARFLDRELTVKQIMADKALKSEWDGYQKEVKALGRQVKGYDDTIWIANREKCVKRISLEKYHQNPKLKRVLTDTFGTRLCEANPYDKIWACGLRESDPKAQDPLQWPGLNLLGKILTELRDSYI